MRLEGRLPCVAGLPVFRSRRITFPLFWITFPLIWITLPLFWITLRRFWITFMGGFTCLLCSRMGKTGVAGSLSHFHARFWRGGCVTHVFAADPVSRDTGFADFWCPWAPKCSGFVLIRFRFTSEIQTSADRRTGADFARLGVWASCASVPDASTGTIQYRLSEAALCMPRSPASSSLVAHQKQPVSRDLWENRCPWGRARLRSAGLASVCTSRFFRHELKHCPRWGL